jgi:hypothetical protein
VSVQTYPVPVVRVREAFPRAAVPGRRATDYAELPYPGEQPATSWVGQDELVEPISARAAATWTTDSGESLDDYLARLGAAPLAERTPVLVYGASTSPQRAARAVESLPTPADRVIVTMRCLVPDVAAVWCSDRRSRGDVPATIVRDEGRLERHSLQWLTAEQMAAVDGRDGALVDEPAYKRCWLPTGVLVEDLRRITRVLVYVGQRAGYTPLQHDGAPVRMADVDQAGVDALLTAAASSGAPVPVGATWDLPPAELPYPVAKVEGVPLFIYGTLKPGESRWPQLKPFLEGDLVPTHVGGRLWDTGLGHPAWTAPDTVEDEGRVEGLYGVLSSSAAARAWAHVVDVEGGVEGDYEPYVVRTELGRLALSFGYGGYRARLRPISGWKCGPVV